MNGSGRGTVDGGSSDDEREGTSDDEREGASEDERFEAANGRGAVLGKAGEGAAAQAIECLIRIGGVDFVLVPGTRAAGGAQLGGTSARGVSTTRRRLWDARREARLTQAELAKRLGRSQAMVSMAESGGCHVGERYVEKVLEACELPARWGLPEESSEAPSGWDLDPRDIAGLDPVTLVPVRRGSERDLELRRKLVWWEGYVDET